MNDEFDILVVEDEQVIIDAAKKILMLDGFVVDEALDAETALEKFHRNKYKLIISDLMLPNISGIELIKVVKAKNAEIPIIIITGYAMLENAVKSFKMGAFDFIPKPFDMEELLGVIYRAINTLKLKQESALEEKRLGFLNDKQLVTKKAGKYYFLGEHSWARFDQNNEISFGVGDTISGKMGEIQKIELPFISTEVWQGNLCVRIISQENLVHMVWAPLSGKIIGINQNIEKNMNIINTDPFNSGWLVKILPTNLESELKNLTSYEC